MFNMLKLNPNVKIPTNVYVYNYASRSVPPRGDYNTLISDIFRSIGLNVQPLL